ncbi:hypothetical protein CC78DRAFT_577211 [Lojkania enalia]|uniref:Uncharacterized protein n=1 Tax=Lojkania enalia TaxID=147567 RepID=A0A9P4KF64_9PLEO|nr:hypothetical protein CC78DRAFT_577211 [Didymosphaeria enalia]
MPKRDGLGAAGRRLLCVLSQAKTNAFQSRPIKRQSRRARRSLPRILQIRAEGQWRAPERTSSLFRQLARSCLPRLRHQALAPLARKSASKGPSEGAQGPFQGPSKDPAAPSSRGARVISASPTPPRRGPASTSLSSTAHGLDAYTAHCQPHTGHDACHTRAAVWSTAAKHPATDVYRRDREVQEPPTG